MAGYTQAELVAILSASGIGSTDAQRRLANVITKAYVDIGVIRAVSTTGGAGAPLYNYNTRKYVAGMSKPLIDLATACYGQGYTAGQITALAQTEAYGPLSYSFATYAPDIVQAIFACMEAGAEVLTNGTTFGANWTPNTDFAISGSAAVYTHSGGNGYMQHSTVTITSGAWYVFDYEISSAATAPTSVTLLQLLGSGTTYVPAASAALVTYDSNALTGIGVARKGSVFFKAAATATALFRFNATSSGSTTFTIDNVSLKEIPNSAFSTNPLSNFTADQALYYGSLGSNYVKRFIAGVVTTTLQKIAEGEYSVYGTLNKQAEPNLEYFTT